ncbi:hypothetical protein FTUN_1301 [Frigoriglobus tundricola]|uniref:Uncharacterized protein n=1 Tax=Frigoriglobus tundricola TaxID=2774151 RepID=A0A6M5YKC6_9BACT|nr:hypothetical protein FTUN_1301 [Frigoriglobus tundricola]
MVVQCDYLGPELQRLAGGASASSCHCTRPPHPKTSNLALHRIRPLSLFPVAHRFRLPHTGVAAGPVSLYVRRGRPTTGGG